MLTFGKKIAAGFFVTFLLLAGIGIVAFQSISTLTNTSYWVTHTNQVLDAVGGILQAMTDAETGQRGYVITGDPMFLDSYKSGTSEVGQQVKSVRELTRDNPHQQKRLDELEPLVALKLQEMQHVIDLRNSQGADAAIKFVQNAQGKKTMDQIRQLLAEMDREERDLLVQRAGEVESASANGRTTIGWGTGVCLLFVIGVGWYLSSTLSRQITQAVQHVQSSSTELQAAANQQVTGVKESATSMAEITTTVTELLATSRQIADSAKRVTQIAEQTLSSSRSGEGMVEQARDSIGTIRNQTDLVVGHMLDLGRKSQQIGLVLDIVAELAEQTNILAINASIEAAGANESGKRFAVVADEIRKLADRVTSSTKEIRSLIDDVRSAVNTTVMATETTSKSVDGGARQFGEVASWFKQIAASVTVTTEASREIELSTKQQATAVEQVNLAVANVAQASRETEVSSAQTLQTIAQLASLSTELLRMVRAGDAS
jgi:CHASE3 domain sensor protein